MDKEEFETVRKKAIIKAWKEPDFKARLIANPREALEEIGCDFPADVGIYVTEDASTIQEKEGVWNFILPPAPADTKTLSDAELEKSAAAGGICGCKLFTDTG